MISGCMKCKSHPALPVALGTILKLHHASTRRRRERTSNTTTKKTIFPNEHRLLRLFIKYKHCSLGPSLQNIYSTRIEQSKFKIK